MKDLKKEDTIIDQLSIDGFEKRDGIRVPFNIQKIELAISKASDSIARQENSEPEKDLGKKVS